MTTSDPTPRQRQIAAFIAALARLDAAGRARLKRNAGRTLAQARDAQRVFFQALPYEVAKHRDEEETYFLIATLYPIARSRVDGASLGTTMRQVGQSRTSASLDRRFQALLDSDREQLHFRLRQAVRLAAATDQPIDWARLLGDLLAWAHPDRYIQLRWAKDYYLEHPEVDQGQPA